MPDLGSFRSWVRDGAVAGTWLTTQFLLTITVLQYQLDLRGAARTVGDNFGDGFVAAVLTGLVGGMVSAVLWWPAKRAYRFHPFLSFLGGPLWGVAVACVGLAVSLSATHTRGSLFNVHWGIVSLLGTGTVLLAWPVYVVLRQRGRGGWPALAVAAMSMVLPIGFVELTR